jgi:hypothetical protein
MTKVFLALHYSDQDLTCLQVFSSVEVIRPLALFDLDFSINFRHFPLLLQWTYFDFRIIFLNFLSFTTSFWSSFECLQLELILAWVVFPLRLLLQLSLLIFSFRQVSLKIIPFAFMPEWLFFRTITVPS